MPLSIAYEEACLRPQADVLAARLGLKVDNQSSEQLCVNADRLLLKIAPFLPLYADFSSAFWQKRRDAGKKQGLVKACKPVPGMRIIDATAGWGRDAAVLASFGAEVIMLERNPVMAVLLEDALLHRSDAPSRAVLPLSLIHVNAFDYLAELAAAEYPDVIFIDPMHPARQKKALVKKDLQVLQQLIGADTDASSLLTMARKRALQKVVVKWPQQLPALQKPWASIPGKTVRFDIYLSE